MDDKIIKCYVPSGILTKKNRIRVYKLARKMYVKDIANDLAHKVAHCSGMCKYIDNAVYDLGFGGVHRSYVAEAWPEYYSFKPKKGWKSNPNFWWSLDISRKCHMRRVAVLTALAKGKSKGE